LVSAKLIQEALKVSQALGERLAPQLTVEASNAAERLLMETGLMGRTELHGSKVAKELLHPENLKSAEGLARQIFKTPEGGPFGSFSFVDRPVERLPGWDHDRLSVFDRNGIFGHESGHIETARPKSALFDGGEPLKIIPREDIEQPPQSMTPRAYKVLQDGGVANWDHGAVYPLPKQLPDGQWQPGNWVEPGKSKVVEDVQKIIGGDREPGLYISNNPNLWKASEPGMVTYEVEVGDEKSQAMWKAVAAPLRVDFIAQRLRLLRPVSPKEFAAIETTSEDYLGVGIYNRSGR
jgi:hypothetical protein